MDILPEFIVLHASASTFEQAIDIVLKRIPNHLDKDAIRAGVLAREQLGTTDLGCGVAIPHYRIEGLDEPMLLALVLKDPLPGSSIRMLMLLLTDQNRPSQHLSCLAAAARRLRDAQLVAELCEASESSQFAGLWNSWAE